MDANSYDNAGFILRQYPIFNRKLYFLEILIRNILIPKKQILLLDIDHTLNIGLNIYQLRIETKSLKI